MTSDILIGSVVVVTAVAAMFALVLWSRRTIGRIARRGEGNRSAREILQELRNGK